MTLPRPAAPDPSCARSWVVFVLAASCATALALLALAACGTSGGNRDLVVTSFSPKEQTDDASSIELRFDRPAVTEAEVGKPVAPSSVVIAPEVAWEGHWQDRQTLVVTPKAALKGSTRYKVSLAGELARRTDGFSFTFVHRPLVVEGIWGVDVEAVPPDGDLPVAFNQAVKATDAAAHCALQTADGKRIALAAAEPTASDTTVALRPAQKLTPAGEYTLSCEGLVGDGGDAALAAPYTLALHARPNLFVVQATPDGSDVAADEVTIEIQFSTAVALEAARAAVTATPAIPGIDQGLLDASGKRYKVTADLDTDTDYQVSIKSLIDVHGQKLTAPFSHSFHTGDARPRISMERGIYALEASAHGYPVWTRNVKSYDIACAAIPKDRLVKLLTTEMNYDPWGGNDSSSAIDWKAFAATPRTSKLKIDGAKNKWHLDELELGSLCSSAAGARGVYLADITSKEIEPDTDRPWLTPSNHRVLANLTDLGVLLKVGPANGVVWVTSLGTGRPVAGARVTVYTPQGQRMFSGATDGDGLVRTPGSAALKKQGSVDDTADLDDEEGGDWDSYRSQRLIAIVEKDADLAIVDGNWANGIQIWNFGLPEERRGGATRIRGFIQSDRGLYRPGEEVHFKGIVREIAAGQPPRVPRKQPVMIQVEDSRGTTVLDKKVSMTAFGGFAFDLSLAKEAVLGDYYVTARVADQVFRERFQVEEFRTAAFEVGLAGTDKIVRPGARLAFSVDARYLFGAPVGGAKVEWNVRRRAHELRFKGYDEYSFDASGRMWWWWDEDRDDYGSHVSDGEGTTNDRGVYSFAVRDPEKADGPQDYIVSANVTDSSDQTLSKSVVVTAHKNDFYLGLHTQEYVQAVGMPFGVNIVAIDPEGRRVAAQANLSFIRTSYDCKWSDHGARSYQSCTSHEEVALQRPVAVPATGTATERIYPKDPGDYLVKIEATDGRGNAVVATSQLWVIGKGEAFWSGDESARMTLVASKHSYQPGDTARLVAQANLKSPTALVTIERDGILDAFVRPLAAASEGVELTIQDAWAPNVFASVAMVQGRIGDGDRNRPQFKMGMVELAVTSDHKRLDVTVELDKDEVRPGDKVTGTVKVTSAGKPVKAELSLSAADEGVLQLIAYKTPDPMKTFYATWGLGVDSGTNWNRIARLADPASDDPDEGGDADGETDEQRVRSRFVSSAYWAPNLYTDDNGVVSFSFVAPDNLTAFRLMAVAADVGDRFGAGERRLTVNKPLMATAALPRFLSSGDVASVGVVVHNHSATAGNATVTARAVGVALRATSQTVAVPAGGSARVRFAATASDNASASFEFAVAMNGEQDALKVALPIDRPRVIETRTVVAGTMPAAGAIDGDLAVAPQVLRGESQLVVTVDRTGLSDLEPSLRYLVEYPYGCLEQTLSRFIPLVKAKDLSRSLELKGLAGTRMDAFIKAGVAKVARHQQGDGHFSLWPQSQTYPQLTVQALWGLHEAQKAGVAVPPEVMTRGLAALDGWMKRDDALKPNGDGATLAMAAFLFAELGKPDAGLNSRLYGLRAGLPRWGQAFLLRALVAAKADAKVIADVRAELTAAAVVSGDRAIVHEAGGEHSYYMNSDVRASAMTLSALLAAAPDDPLIPKLAAGLAAERGPDGAWHNTQENLWSLVALADFARRASGGDATVTIAAGDKVLSKRKLIGSQVHVLRVGLDKLGADKIKVSADGPVHYAVRVTQSTRDGGEGASHGFMIRREYLDPHGAPVQMVKAGDLVTVRLTVTADADRRWVAMVDPLPAGLEAVNPKLATSVSTGAAGTATPPAGASGSRYDIQWAHQELRDDQVQWFADWMSRGTYVLAYQARATVDGTFAVAPARIEAMYEPEIMGRTAATTMTVGK